MQIFGVILPLTQQRRNGQTDVKQQIWVELPKKGVKPYNCFQSQGRVKQNLTEQAYSSYCFFSCRVNSTLNSFLCQATVSVILHQSSLKWACFIICHAYVSHHAKLECHTQNTVQNTTIKLQVKNWSSLRCSGDLEWRSRLSDRQRLYRHLSQTILVSS